MSGIESIVATGATTLAVDLLRRLAGPAADQVGLMLGDKAWEYRANNLIKITMRLQRKLRGAGLPANAVPPRLLLPIIENCSVEDNETLQDMWAGLLATASQETDSMSPSFIETLKQLTPDEARQLEYLAGETAKNSGTEALAPRAAVPDSIYRNRDESQIEIAFDTFERLGLIRRDWSAYIGLPDRFKWHEESQRYPSPEILAESLNEGLTSEYSLSFTEYGSRFLDACRGPRAQSSD